MIARGVGAGGWAVYVALGFLACLSYIPVEGSEPLTKNSPFLPPEAPPNPNAANAAANPNTQNLVFRGVYALGDKLFFNIYNKQENKGTWVGLNDAAATYQILRYDRETNALRMKTGATEIDLTLDRPNWVSVPVQVAAATQPAAPAVAPGRPGGPPANRPSPAAPVRRRVVAPPRPPPQAAPGTVSSQRQQWENMPPSMRPSTPPPSTVPPTPHPDWKPELPEALRNFTPPPPPTNLPGQ